MTKETKNAILDIATEVGQNKALERTIDFASESHARFWATVDFNKTCDEKRFFIFDTVEMKVNKYLVSHGRGSGNNKATHFSNEVGSNCTSLGIYKTKNKYIGSHGNSLRLEGFEKSNSNAYRRDVVIHCAPYVTNTHAGRSLGCFVFNSSVIDYVIECLRDGSYINAWHNENFKL